MGPRTDRSSGGAFEQIIMNKYTLLTVTMLLLASGSSVAIAQDQPEKPAEETPKSVEPGDQPVKGEGAEGAADQKEGPEYRLLRDAADAIASAKSLTYTARAYGTDSMESMSPKTTAAVTMLRDESGTWLVRAKGSGQGRSGGEQQFDVAWRRETVEFLEHKEKKVVERRPRDARSGSLQIASSSRIAELVAPSPYSTLFSSPQLQLEDRQSVDGVDCDVLVATSGARKSKVRWYFSVEDHLPRKVEKIIEGDKIAGMMVVEISGIKAEKETPTVTAEQVRIEVPADYSVDRYQPRGAQDGSMAALPAGEQAKVDSEMQRMFGGGDPGKKGQDPEAAAKDKMQAIEQQRQAMKAAEAKDGKPESTGTPTPAPAPVPTPAPVAAPMTSLPAFELTSTGGQKVTPDSLKGSVAVIDFFGSWMPNKTWQGTLNNSIKDLAGVKVFAASVREKSTESANKALKDRSISWDHLPGADQLAKDLGIKVFPATVVVGKDGSIVEVFQNCRGDETAARIKTAIENASK